jgi:chemosensory pili system protein ChpA (sensor histidine kinase/response regulator)
MLVPRLRRLTRQTAGELGKQAVLEVEGEECELDRNLLQNMTAPLEHLIRNAVSHGIETPEEREQQGKPRNGRITLSVSRDDAEIIIRFRDDGRGLDRKQLRQRGLELGLIKPQDTLPDNELDRLILRPGFTTAKSISQIAGRGIGMDVVNSELKALGGNLQIASKPGEGTTFAMHLPFTLVVNPVLLVDVQTQVYALPITGVPARA